MAKPDETSKKETAGLKTRSDRDIQKIQNGLTRVAAGDYSAKISLSGDDPDLTAIAEALNDTIASVRNATDYFRDANKQLESANKKLKRMFDTSTDIILQVNRYGTLVDINKSVKKVLGYDPEDFIGKHFAKLGVLPGEIIGKVTHKFRDAVNTGKADRVIDLEIKSKDGEKLCMEAGITLLKTGDEIDGAVVVLRNITDHVQADEKMQLQKEKLRAIISSLDDLIFILDKDLRFVEYYQSADMPDLDIYAKPKDYIGKSIKDIFPRPVAQDLEKVVRTCLKTKKSQQFDYPWDILGANLWFSARITPILDKEAESSGVTVLVRDITSRIKIEKALEESEKKYRNIFENSPQGFILLDTEGRIIDVNKKICDWLGYKPEEILGKDHILYPFLTKAGKITAMRKFVQRLTGKTIPAYELEFVTKSGEIFLGEVVAMQIRDDKDRVKQFLTMITAITSRRDTGAKKGD